MKLSVRVVFAISVLACLPLSQLVRADTPVVAPSSGTQDWEQVLLRRIERTLPALLASLAAVRREHDEGLVRCFDRAVTGLNSVQRQVTFHAEQRDEASSEQERARHARALARLSARVEELARSVQTCFTDGIVVKDGDTVVEVVVEKKR